MMVMETVTDVTGRFFFPAWGPKPRPPEGYLHNDDPGLLLFKSGYKYLGLANRLTEKPNPSPLRRSDWNGQTIKLKKFEGSLEEYAKHLGHLNTSLSFATGGWVKDCEWKQIPRMLAAMHLEKMRFKEKGISNHIYLAPIDTMPNQTQCGSAQEFFRSYIP